MEERSAQAQVWERVFARNGEQPRDDLRELLAAATELAGVYRHLAGTLTGKPRERVRQLYEEELANIACLKGLGILAGRREEVLKIWAPSREPGKKLLEKCYHRSRRCMVNYMGYSAEPEFGVVFQKLAEREGQHCALIAELLGML